MRIWPLGGVQIVFLFICLSVVPAVADSDLIGHWTLDDGGGTTALDSATTNHGILVGGPNWQSSGRLGGSLSFDGVDDLIDLGTPDYSTFPFDLTDKMTIAFWMRADSFAVTDARLVSRATGTSEQAHFWMVSTVNQTGLRFRLKTDGLTTTLESADGLLQIGQWHHVAAVFNGQEMQLYRDGILVANSPKFGTIDDDPAVGLAIGNQPPNAGVRPFAGQIDDVRLYRRALPQVEIGNLSYPDFNQAPTASFSATPLNGKPPLEVEFDASNSFDVDGTIIDYSWDFGDFVGGSGMSVSHEYADLGHYFPILTVTDNEGIAAFDTLEVVVSNTPLILIPFTHEVVDENPPNLVHCKAAADIDGDGLKDIFAAGAGDGDGFYWYQNPTWEKTTIVPAGISGYSTEMTVGDVDGDGDMDAIIPKGFDYGDSVFWYENPRPNGDPKVDVWVEHAIAVAPAHDIEVGDIDNNGLLDVMVRWEDTTVILQTAPDVWSAVVINSRDNEGLELADLDDDGDLDAVINGYWLVNPLPGLAPDVGQWTEQVIDTNWPEAARVHAADIDGNGVLDVIFAASESVGNRLSWYSAVDPINGPWTEHLIDEIADYIHTLEAADMDLDGDLDIIAAEMHQSVDPDNVIIFRNEGEGQTWAPQVVATTGSHNMIVADLDADGDIDLLGANHALPPLEVWINELNPQAPYQLDQWNRYVADIGMPWQAIFIDPVRIDADEFPDVVVGGWWYRNPGSAGGSWLRSTLGLPLNNMNLVYDFDEDGDLDVLGTQGEDFEDNNLFAWARNDGMGGFTVFENIPPAVGKFLQGSTATKFQPNGPIEVALAWQDGEDTQFLTVPSDPAVEQWGWSVVSDATLGEAMVYGDIDGDGDLDILQGTQWLRNDGGTWTPFVLFPLSPLGETDRVFLIDLNSDGRLDSLVSYGHDRAYGSLSWYEQPLVAEDMWIEHVIDNPFNPQSLDIADLDLDGDIDIVMGEHNRFDPTSSELVIYENLGVAGDAWRKRLIYLGDEHHDGALLFDVELDGDLDIVSIGYTHRRLMIYENLSRSYEPSGVQDPTVPSPSRLKLSTPYPNPFNPATTLSYELPTTSRVTLKVYDVRGRMVADLVSEVQAAGRYELLFAPRGLASGVYLAHLRAGGEVRTMRMLLIK